MPLFSLFIALVLGAALAQPVQAMQFTYGSYTGNAPSNQSITGLGFQPDAVIIKGDTDQFAVMRTATMTGDATKELAAATALQTGRIQSLDVDGFTVGTNFQVNNSGVTYFWMAFRDNGAGDFKVSSYTGDGVGNRSITGVGFQPDYVIVMRAGASPAVQRSSAMMGDSSFRFDATGSQIGRIQALKVDGFQVGTNAEVNTSGDTYHYVAWKNVAGKMAVGSYTGNGTGNRSITGVGFSPEYVIIKANAANQGVHRSASSGVGDSTLLFVATANLANAIQALEADGFQVGTDPTVNTSGTTYFWMAFDTTPTQLTITSVNGGTNPTAGTGFPVVVEAQDANGNRGNVATATGVSLSLTTGTGTLGGTLTGTIAAGTSQVTISGVTYTKAESGVVLTATSTSGDVLTAGNSTAFTVDPGTATKLAFTTQPGGCVRSTVCTTQPVVTVQDANGNTVTTSSASITLAIGTDPAGSTTLAATTNPVAASSGVATFAGVSLTKSGAGYTLTASSAGLSAATSSSFTVSGAAKLAFTTQPGGASKGVTLTTQPGVTVQRDDGTTETTATTTVTVVIKAGTGAAGAALSGTTSVAAVSGVATFTTLAIDKSGQGYQLTASAPTLTSADSAAFTVSGAAKLAFTTQPGNATAGSAIPGPPTVTVQRDDGSTESTATAAITVAIGTNPAGGTLAGTTPKNATAGVASFSDLSINKAGTGYTLTAAATGLSGATSSTFNVTAGTATKLAFTTQPGGCVRSTVCTTQPVVTVQDANGNTVTSASASITLAIGTDPAGSTTLAATANPVAASSGVATFAGVSLTKSGAGYTLTASSAGLSAATSSSFTVSGAAKLALTTQPGNATAGSAIPGPPTVTVQRDDGSTELTSTAAITVAIGTNPAGGTLAGTTPKSATAGVASFSDLSINKAGTGYTLTAAATGLTGATSSTFNVTAGTATKLAFTTQPGGASKGVALTTQPGVEIQDATGNRVTTATTTVTLAIKSGTGATGATLSGTIAVNAVNGVATFTTLSIDKFGAGYQLTASATGLTSADSAAFTVSGAFKLAFTTQPGTATVGSAIPGPPTVTVQRDDGSTESTATAAITLAIGINPAGGALSGTTTKSTTAGVASFDKVSLDKVGSGYTLAASSAGLIGATSASFEATAVVPIPTLSEWGRLLLALLLAALAVRTLRRQRLRG